MLNQAWLNEVKKIGNPVVVQIILVSMSVRFCFVMFTCCSARWACCLNRWRLCSVSGRSCSMMYILCSVHAGFGSKPFASCSVRFTFSQEWFTCCLEECNSCLESALLILISRTQVSEPERIVVNWCRSGCLKKYAWIKNQDQKSLPHSILIRFSTHCRPVRTDCYWQFRQAQQTGVRPDYQAVVYYVI